jgi:hypothetical protein
MVAEAATRRYTWGWGGGIFHIDGIVRADVPFGKAAIKYHGGGGTTVAFVFETFNPISTPHPGRGPTSLEMSWHT